MKLTTILTSILFTFSFIGVALGQIAPTRTSQPSTPTPSVRPENGEVLSSPGLSSMTGFHTFTVENNSGYDAIVKLEDTSDDSTYRLVFIRKDAIYTIENIKDGTFQIKFALGSDYSPEKKMFAKLIGLTQFDEPQTLVTRIERTATGTTRITDRISISLAPTANGNAETSKISLKDF